MKVRTVRGDIAPEALGITLPHEHLLVDVSLRRRTTNDPYLRRIAEAPVTMDILSDLRRNPTISADSLRLDDPDMAMKELGFFKEAGGRSLVEQTSRWIGGDPAVLRRISEATGVAIVACCAYYSPAVPDDVDRVSIDVLADRLVAEVTRGFAGTDIKAGIIGEIGTSWPLAPHEEKLLRAAARAQRATGAALSIHPSPFDKQAKPLLDIVASEGVDMQRVVMCHLDHVLDVEYHEAIADRGVFIEYDRFGVEWYRSLVHSRQVFPRDVERVAALVELIGRGHLGQILISHDVCQKIETRSYGGHGYSHILRYVVPMMKEMGIDEAGIRAMLVDNPRRMLAF